MEQLEMFLNDAQVIKLTGRKTGHMQDDQTSCIEVEFSTVWMLEHPEFFCASFLEFAAKCKDRGWNITSRSQEGFLTLIGSAEKDPANLV